MEDCRNTICPDFFIVEGIESRKHFADIRLSHTGVFQEISGNSSGLYFFDSTVAVIFALDEFPRVMKKSRNHRNQRIQIFCLRQPAGNGCHVSGVFPEETLRAVLISFVGFFGIQDDFTDLVYQPGKPGLDHSENGHFFGGHKRGIIPRAHRKRQGDTSAVG